MLCYTLLYLLGLGSIVKTQRIYHDPYCLEGRTAIVQLFEWGWNDVATECENVLGPRKYCGVQISPPSEHVIITPYRSWWERYEPVSYKLESRSGNDRQLQDMVTRCNNAGVRVYVDAVINHMTDASRFGLGTAGSPFDGAAFFFPEVPFSSPDFNNCQGCPACCCIQSTDWGSPRIVRNCRHEGRLDLNHKVPNVVNSIATYLNRLIGMGVAGFHIDSTSNIWPRDLSIILNKMNNLDIRWFESGSKPFIYQEVIAIDMPGAIEAQEYLDTGMVTEFRYGPRIREAVDDLSLVPDLYNPDIGMVGVGDAIVFVDNHLSQRGLGITDSVLTFADPEKYQVAQAITLALNYGIPRVMSSYRYDDINSGPPIESRHLNDGNLKRKNCDGDWVCEHRWQTVASMVTFAGTVSGTTVINLVTDAATVSWSRGNKGFFMVSNGGPKEETFVTGLPPGEYCNVVEGDPTGYGCEGSSISVNPDGCVDVTIENNSTYILAIHVGALYGSGPSTTTELVTTVEMTTEPEFETTLEEYTTAPDILTEEITFPETTLSFTTGDMTEEVTNPDTTYKIWTPTIEETTIEMTTQPETTELYTTEAVTTLPTTTPAPILNTTVILLYKETRVNEFVFIRGGIDDSRRDCTPNYPRMDPCAIDIDHLPLADEDPDCHFKSYEDFSKGNRRLNWYQFGYPGQGKWNNQIPYGTPMAWTTNNPSQPGFNGYNRFWKIIAQQNRSIMAVTYDKIKHIIKSYLALYSHLTSRWGPHHWAVAFEMDCSQTVNGWFEFRAVHVGYFGNEFTYQESHINQAEKCEGLA